MGRASLLTVAWLGLVGCAASPAVQEFGHLALACSECHQGPTADRELAFVPPETCTASECHQSSVPGSITLKTVRFEHRGHGSTDELAVGCAGCHTHSTGGAPITGSDGTCGLCHQEELAGPRGDGCRMCHTDLSYNGFTPQGLAIQHDDLPLFGRGCSRCHYEVTVPVQETAIERCVACHEDGAAIQRSGIGVDLHPSHVSVSCESCHETDTHHIESMSSAVSLVCVDCHAVEHAVELNPSWPEPAMCVACHRQSHVQQQSFLLGIDASGAVPSPAEHFTSGLVCRSCHVEGSGSPPVSAAAGAACVTCHRDEYQTVGRWWVEGVGDRMALVEPYLATAEGVVGRLATSDERRAQLSVSRGRLELLRSAGGEHNVRLAHQIFEEVVDASTAVLEASGVVASSEPALGEPPRSGFCTYCHYQIDQERTTEGMPEDFHREVMAR